MTEPQKIRKIVLENSQFSVLNGLIFNEKLFVVAPQFSTEQRIFITGPKD